MTLQQQVQQHLANTGISLRELSRRSGVSHTTIGKILRGGEYKNKTAYALNTVILRDSNFAKIVCSADDQPSDFLLESRSAFETLDATVEQLAVQCIDADLTHVRDTDLECAKYRRVMALEAELDAWQLKCGKERDKAEKLQWSLNKSEAFALVVTKDLQIMQASWKAACVQAEHLQKQLDHANSEIVRMDAQLDQALETSQKNAASAFESALNRDALQSRFDTLFVGRANMRTKYEYSLMRLRMYVWILIAALVFVLVSGLVVWGGV